MRVLFIDNFDSFTFNLVDEFRKRDCEVSVYRNSITEDQLKRLLEQYKPDLIVISPGPSSPKEAGICEHLIRTYHGRYPMFGVCLGHQCMISAMGGKVERSDSPVHGKRSAITHDGSVLFKGIPKRFYAARYHSLTGTAIPDCFRVTATSGDLVMAVENKDKMFGVQFHPESILTAEGGRMIENIIAICR